MFGDNEMLDCTPMVRETKYEGQDQILFAELKAGEVFGHISHIFKNFRVMSPYTIKTNEKTKYIIIEKAALEITSREGMSISSFLLDDFNLKYRYMRDLKCLGDMRHSFNRMLPLVSKCQTRKIPKNSLIIR